MTRLYALLVAATLTACVDPAMRAPDVAETTSSRLYPNHLTVSDQASVDALAGYTGVGGHLLITGPNVVEVDLPLFERAASLTIRDAPNLQRVVLPALNEVPGTVWLLNLPALHTVELSSLTEARAGLRVQGAPLLTTLALPALRRAAGVLIEGVAALAQLGLPRWQGPGGGLYVRDAPALTALQLDALLELEEGMVLERVGLLTLTAPRLRSLGDRLELTDLDQLVDASFPALRQAHGVDVSECAALRRLHLGGLRRVGEWLTLLELPSLVDLRLDRLREVGAGVHLEGITAPAGLTLPALEAAERLMLVAEGDVPVVRLPALRRAGQLFVRGADGPDGVGVDVLLPSLVVVNQLIVDGHVETLHVPALRGTTCLSVNLTGDAAPLSFPSLEQARYLTVSVQRPTVARDLLLPQLHRSVDVDIRGRASYPYNVDVLGEVDLSSFGTHRGLTPEIDAGYPSTWSWHARTAGCHPSGRALRRGPRVVVRGAAHLSMGPLQDAQASLSVTKADIASPAGGTVEVRADLAVVHGEGSTGTLRILDGEVDATNLRSVGTLELVIAGSFVAPNLHTITHQLTISQADEVSLPALVGHDALFVRLWQVRRVHLPALTEADSVLLWDGSPARTWFDALSGVQITGEIELEVPSLSTLRALSVRQQPRLRALDLPALTGRIDTLEVLFGSDLERLSAPSLEEVGVLQILTTPSDPANPADLDLDLSSLSTLDHAWFEGAYTLGTLSLPSLLGPADDLIVRAGAGVSAVQLPELQHAGRLYLEGADLQLSAPALRTVQTLELGADLDVFTQALTPPGAAAPLSLPSLEEAGWLRLAHHGGLSRLELPALQRLTERLIVQDLPLLTDVNAPSLVEAVGTTWMNFIDLPRLSVARLPALAEVGRLAFVRTGIEEIVYPSVLNFNDHLTAYDNPALTRIAYPNATRALEVYLDHNPELATVELGALAEVGAVTVWGHDALTSLDLGGLSSVSGELWIEGNTSLQTLSLAGSGEAGAWTVVHNPQLDGCAVGVLAQGWQIGTFVAQDNGPCGP